MTAPEIKPLRERARLVLQRDGAGRFVSKSALYLAAEGLRWRLKMQARKGPALIAANRGRPPAPSSVSSIAFLRFWGMGDMVLAIPALRMLRQRFPDARLIMVGSTGAARVLEGVGAFDDAVTAPLSATESSTPALYRALERVRGLRPDLVFASYPLLSWRLAEAVNLLGAKWAYAAAPEVDPGWVTAAAEAEPGMSVARVNVEMARLAGCEGRIPSIELWLTDAEREKAAKWIERNAPERPRICVHIGSTPGFGRKMWSVKHFADLVDALHRRWGKKAILLEGPDEREAVRSLTAAVRVPLVIAGAELSLRETMALVGSMDLVIGGSAVWTHVAAALGAPTLCIVGPTSTSYDPFGNAGPVAVVRSSADCAPCFEPGRSFPCEHARCMDEISPDRVGQAAADLLVQAGFRPD